MYSEPVYKDRSRWKWKVVVMAGFPNFCRGSFSTGFNEKPYPRVFIDGWPFYTGLTVLLLRYEYKGK